MQTLYSFRLPCRAPSLDGGASIPPGCEARDALRIKWTLSEKLELCVFTGLFWGESHPIVEYRGTPATHQNVVSFELGVSLGEVNTHVRASGLGPRQRTTSDEPH